MRHLAVGFPFIGSLRKGAGPFCQAGRICRRRGTGRHAREGRANVPLRAARQPGITRRSRMTPKRREGRNPRLNIAGPCHARSAVSDLSGLESVPAVPPQHPPIAGYAAQNTMWRVPRWQIQARPGMSLTRQGRPTSRRSGRRRKHSPPRRLLRKGKGQARSVAWTSRSASSTRHQSLHGDHRHDQRKTGKRISEFGRRRLGLWDRAVKAFSDRRGGQEDGRKQCEKAAHVRSAA